MLRKMFSFVVFTFLFINAAFSQEGPIAYLGHGEAFDRNGKRIDLSIKNIEQIQIFYLRQLEDLLSSNERQIYNQKKSSVFSNKNWTSREDVIVRNSLIEYLTRSQEDEIKDIKSKLYTLDRLFKKRHPKLSSSTYRGHKTIERGIEIPQFLIQQLDSEGLKLMSAEALETPNETEDYTKQCFNAGVPTPPNWGEGQWISHGTLENEFISKEEVAEVFSFKSSEPEGMCIALPRYEGDTIKLLGIICLGKKTNNACFWDNQREGINYPIPKNQPVPLSEFAGGPDLNGGQGGTCTECHVGDNPYIIHPKTSLGLPKLAGLPLFSDNPPYTPLVHPNWPKNDKFTSIIGACSSCHFNAGPGGNFPDTAANIGYCGTVLRQAAKGDITIGNDGSEIITVPTMPPHNPGDSTFESHVNALLAPCTAN